MRTHRVLPLALLAAAFGFVAVAHADIAVTTVIIDPNGDPNTWQVKARMWGDLGPGTPADSLGYLDFVFYSVVPTGTWVVTNSQNVSPESYFLPSDANDPHDPVPTGFTSIRSDGIDGWGIIGKQNGEYEEGDPVSNPEGLTQDVLDEAIFLGIGVQAGSWNPTLPGGYTIGPNGTDMQWEADALIAQGTYDPNAGAGSLTMSSFGVESFTVLPKDGGGTYTGPTHDVGENSWVTAHVTQTMVGGTGNDGGGAGYDRVTDVTVENGLYVMNANAGTPAAAGVAAVPYVNLTVGGAPGMTAASPA